MLVRVLVLSLIEDGVHDSPITSILEMSTPFQLLSTNPQINWKKNCIVLVEGSQATFSKISMLSKAILLLEDKDIPFWLVLTLSKDL